MKRRLRKQTVFASGGTPAGSLPDEVLDFPNPGQISNVASDHRPVLARMMLPLESLERKGE